MAVKSLPIDLQKAIWIGDSLFVEKLRKEYWNERESQDSSSVERRQSLKPPSLDLGATRLIILPVNTGNRHWSLAAIFLPAADNGIAENAEASTPSNEGMIVICDSLHSTIPDQRQLMVCINRYVVRNDHLSHQNLVV